MSRSAPWLLLAVLATAVACGGATWATLIGAAWSLDGSRAWWVADARGAVAALAGALGALAAAAVVAGIGAVILRRPSPPPPAGRERA